MANARVRRVLAGAPVGRELGRYYLKEELERSTKGKQSGTDREKQSRTDGSAPGMPSVAAPVASANSSFNEALALGSRTDDSADGSVIVVIATDAPLDSRNLGRLAARAMMGLARTGGAASNGSGDYAILCTVPSVRIRSAAGQPRTRQVELLSTTRCSSLPGVIERQKRRLQLTLSRDRYDWARPQSRSAAYRPNARILRKYGLIPRSSSGTPHSLRHMRWPQKHRCAQVSSTQSERTAYHDCTLPRIRHAGGSARPLVFARAMPIRSLGGKRVRQTQYS